MALGAVAPSAPAALIFQGLVQRIVQAGRRHRFNQHRIGLQWPDGRDGRIDAIAREGIEHGHHRQMLGHAAHLAQRIRHVHAGHVPVGQQHMARRLRLQPLQGRIERCRRFRLPAPRPYQFAHQRAAGGIVVGHQHALCRRSRWPQRVSPLRHHAKRQAEPETAAFARCTIHGDASPHQFNQFLGNGQSQPGAAKAARNAFIALGKGVEQLGLLRRADADAGIGHLEAQRGPVTVALRERHAHHHFAAGRDRPFAGNRFCRAGSGIRTRLSWHGGSRGP